MKKTKGSGIIFICQNRVLLLQSPRGIWEIPGGKKNFTESYVQAAKRETLEEIGWCPCIDIAGEYTCEGKKTKYKVFYVFLDKAFTCNLSREHIHWNWFSLDRLSNNINKKIADALDFLKKSALASDNIDTV